VYGPGAAAATAFPQRGIEHSGSLTGHILAQGSVDAPAPKSRTTKVIIIMVVVLLVLVGVGLLAGMFASDLINDLFGGLFNDA